MLRKGTCQRQFRSSTVQGFTRFVAVVLVTVCGAESCGFPGSPAHAKVHTSDDRFREGTVVTFECDPGYRMLGRSSLRCVNSEWDSPGLPYCAREVAFRKPSGMSSRNASSGLAIDDDRMTCAETAFGNTHHWWVDLLEDYVVVNVVEVRFGMEIKNATVSISLDGHRTNSSSLCTRWRGIDLSVDGAKYFSCGRGANPTHKPSSAVGRADDIPATNRTSGGEDETGLGLAGDTRGRYVSISVEAAHGFSLRLCEVSVFSQELLSPEDVCGEAGGKIESFQGTCYEATPHEMPYKEAVELCAKKGGRLWPSSTDSTADSEGEDERVPGDQGMDRKEEEKFVSWMMDVHNLGRVWAAERKPASPATAAKAKAPSTSTVPTTPAASTTELPTTTFESTTVGNATINGTKINDESDETSRALWTGVDPPSVNVNRTCGVFLPSGGTREAARSSQDSPCNEAVFGICVRGPNSCGRPVLPKRMASWKSLERMAPGDVFAAFECEQGYFISGPASIHCKKRGGFHQQMATQCRRSMCGAPPLVANSFAVLDDDRPHLSCVNDSFILHGRARLHCDPLAARWDHPMMTCIHMPTGVIYHDQSFIDKLAQGVQLFPMASRIGAILLLVALLFLNVLMTVACANLLHFFRVVKPRLDRKADSSTMLSKIREELYGDAEGDLSKSPPSNGGHLSLPTDATTEDLELSHNDFRFITRVCAPEECSNKSQRNNVSTSTGPDTPKLQLSESPIEDLKFDCTLTLKNV